MPHIALGLSIKTSVPWQASQLEMNSSSRKPRNYKSSALLLLISSETTYALSFLHELDCEHVILHAQLHDLAWIPCDRLELDAVAADPWLEFFVGSNDRIVTLFDKSFTEGNIWLNIAAGSNCEASDV